MNFLLFEGIVLEWEANGGTVSHLVLKGILCGITKNKSGIYFWLLGELLSMVFAPGSW
jgi:hypothetical protein